MYRNIKPVIAVLCVLLTLVVASAACYGTEYTLIFRNDSSNTGDACVYQHDPDMDVQDVMSLAWFAKGAAPTTTITFNWTIDYCFAWDEIGELVPGVIFEAAQIWDADPRGDNCVTLSMLEGGIYTFSDLKHCGYDGNLYIYGDRSLPVRQAAVGIGMAGAATHVAPAQPNWLWVYTPKPLYLYWITFGTFEPGEILDVDSITHKAPVHFPPNVYSMTATLNEDNTWTVQETQW
jgi:hypothetical protein